MVVARGYCPDARDWFGIDGLAVACSEDDHHYGHLELVVDCEFRPIVFRVCGPVAEAVEIVRDGA